LPPLAEFLSDKRVMPRRHSLFPFFVRNFR
jgi:hypothetical protein